MMRRSNILYVCFVFIAVILMTSCRTKDGVQELQTELEKFVENRDATIGIAVIIDGKDTVAVNGDRFFPMLSVYKLPIAIALGDHLRVSGEMLQEPITIYEASLKPDTYSPMRDKYLGRDSLELSLHEILAYALQQSDNNASDILLNIMGEPSRAMLALRRLGIENVNIVNTEDEVHQNPDLCYKNSGTPIAMAKMIDEFDRSFDDRYFREIKQLMETCETGANRLVQPLVGSGAVIGHKTGTGFELPDGRLMAINDVGYVHLPDGSRYSIAVFVENSGYNMEKTEKIISDVSEMIYHSIKEHH